MTDAGHTEAVSARKKIVSSALGIIGGIGAILGVIVFAHQDIIAIFAAFIRFIRH